MRTPKITCSSFYEDESYLKVLKIIEKTPQIGQRELSKELGISLGKTNYCLKALLEKGLIKIGNFKKNTNKLLYLYLLTPSGIKEKTLMTHHFLVKKIKEYDCLKLEIIELQKQILENNQAS